MWCLRSIEDQSIVLCMHTYEKRIQWAKDCALILDQDAQEAMQALYRLKKVVPHSQNADALWTSLHANLPAHKEQVFALADELMAS